MDRSTKSKQKPPITVEDVNRLLEVGRILFSVLTHEEIEELQKLLSPQNAIGNTGDS
jgi:hypothetical protein